MLPKASPDELYKTDFYVWTQEQARLLRERRFDDLDLDNLVDEVQSVGSLEKREIRERLRALLSQLLKWKFQPGLRGGGWRTSIWEQRYNITEIIRGSPSLRSYVPQVMHLAYVGATLAASQDTGLAIGIFPSECPFEANEVLDLEFFPEDREFE
jgi:hypothetical protein